MITIQSRAASSGFDHLHGEESFAMVGVHLDQTEDRETQSTTSDANSRRSDNLFKVPFVT